MHLKDVGNLYNIGDNNIAKIKATINIANSKSQINETIKRFNPNAEGIDLDLLTITRTINGKTFYSIQELQNETEEVQNSVSKEIINQLPKIIYFDDFTDPLPNKINLKDEQFRTWINVVDLLIQSIDNDAKLTIQSLLDSNSSDNLVKSICASMSRKLNTTIVKQWKEIRLENDGVNFKIEVEFDRSKNTLEFKLIEKVNDQDDRYFDIRRRTTHRSLLPIGYHFCCYIKHRQYLYQRENYYKYAVPKNPACLVDAEDLHNWVESSLAAYEERLLLEKTTLEETVNSK